MEKRLRKTRPAWRLVKLLGYGLAGLFLALAASGAAWNYVAVHHDRAINPPPGKLYDVNGYAMHLYCTGVGAPAVILDSGHGEDFTVWGRVQPALSRVTRTCSYDRAGFGWSAPQPGERDANHIADQLHALLFRAGIAEPIILVGHSGGGLYAMVYTSRYSQDVAGLVLVDAYPARPLPAPAFALAMDHHTAVEFAFVKATVALGIARAMGECDSVPAGLEAYAGWIKANECYYPQLNTYIREDRALDDSRREGAFIKSFGNIPLLILSQDTRRAIPAFLAPHISTKDWQSFGVEHDGEQAAFLLLSARSRRVIAPGSGHYIHYDRPDVIIRETTELIEQTRTH